MSYTEDQTGTQRSYTQHQQQQLLTLARESICHGVKHNKPITVTLNEYNETLREIGCCFITLNKLNELRGCIGSLTATQALVKDIADHAFAAAFKDPRFPPVTLNEIDELKISISVLTPQEELLFSSEEEMLTQITPYKDGLSIEENHLRATFLPAVWEKIPDKVEFLQQLKIKAGMHSNYWSSSIRAFRYHTIYFSE